eukprot:1157160-Pelagomonas_calceolata.AAC.2
MQDVSRVRALELQTYILNPSLTGQGFGYLCWEHMNNMPIWGGSRSPLETVLLLTFTHEQVDFAAQKKEASRLLGTEMPQSNIASWFSLPHSN